MEALIHRFQREFWWLILKELSLWSVRGTQFLVFYNCIVPLVPSLCFPSLCFSSLCFPPLSFPCLPFPSLLFSSFPFLSLTLPYFALVSPPSPPLLLSSLLFIVSSPTPSPFCFPMCDCAYRHTMQNNMKLCTFLVHKRERRQTFTLSCFHRWNSVSICTDHCHFHNWVH